LTAILISCAILFLGATLLIIYMLVYFTGCPTNNTFISLTLIFCILLTTVQMTGDEGSLLSSACISAWAAFLCHSAVTKNPNATCNPKVGQTSHLSIIFGLLVTLLSLCWTGWSYTAEDKLVFKAADKDDEEAATMSNAPTVQVANTAEGKPKRTVTGVVTGGTDESGTMQEGNDGDANNAGNNNNNADPTKLSNSWRLNIALAAVSCWSAMTLTQWGEIQSHGTLANPTVGHVAMWLIVGSQWLVMSIYVWTLAAPRLMPNRDFS
jgi:hypothetical protein